MEISNRLNYQQALINACKNHLYHPTWELNRVSELIDSPLIKYLTIKYWDELTIDVDEFINSSLFGTAWHKFLSEYENSSVLTDHVMVIDVNGQQVKGELDVYRPENGGVIEDNKVTSAYAFVFGKIEWEYQLNLYAYLAKQCGYTVNKLQINAFLRDWSKYTAMQNRNKDYPKQRFYSVEIPLWSEEKQRDYLLNRLKVHNENREQECTSHEKWERPTTYAVMKEGRKTALRVLDSEADANNWCKSKKHKAGVNGIYIDKRKGGCIRCQSWCQVRSVCPYAKQ